MNALNKIGVILLWITLGFVLPIQAQTRGLYDVKVSFSHWTQSGWDGGSIVVLEKDLVIHSKVNFIFPSSIPTTHTNGPGDPSDPSFSPTLTAVNLYVKFGNSPNENWKLCTNNASFLVDYAAIMSNVGEENQANITVQFALAVSGVPAPNTTNEYSTLGTVMGTMPSNFSIKHAPNRPYISPDEVLDVITDNIFTPPTGTYSATTVQSSPFFTSYTTATKGEGKAYVLYSNPTNKQITKPIIFVDGIDFSREQYKDPITGKIVRIGDTGWDVFIRGLEEGVLAPNEIEPYRLYKSTFDLLRSKGFDIIFLDFKEGATYIEKNAMVLKKLIKMLNGDKNTGVTGLKKADSQGNYWENIIVGCSMGGQVARLCLAEMEKKNEPTCTSTYVSFDSPHLGANIPLGLQAAAWFSGKVLGDPSLWFALNSPAARQLLVKTIGSEVVAGNLGIFPLQGFDPINVTIPNDDFSLHTAFQNKINALGLPQKTRNLAIACGTNSGSTDNFFTPANMLLRGILNAGSNRVAAFNVNPSAGAKVPYDEIKKVCTFYQGIVGNTVQFPIATIGFPIWQPDNTLFAAVVPVGFQNNIIFAPPTPCSFQGVTMTMNPTSNTPNFDGAVGCYRTDIFSLQRKLTQFAAKQGQALTIDSSQSKTCFMPTMSSFGLNLAGGMNQANLDAAINLDKKSTLNVVRSKKTSFMDVFAPAVNLKHVQINDEIRAWAVAESDASGEAQFGGTLTSTYNFAAKKNTIPSVAIKDGGHLKVNDCIAGNDYYNYDEFHVHIGSCGGTVDVSNNGNLSIGSNVGCSQKGIFHVNPETTLKMSSLSANTLVQRGSSLIVEGSGTFKLDAGILNLQNASKLIIENNGNAIMNGGAIKINDNSQMIIEIGGNATMNSGTIELSEKSQIVIELGGQMTINGGSTNFKDKSQVIIKSGGKMTIKSGVNIGLNDLAQIIVEVGGTLIIEKSANTGSNSKVQFTETVSKPDSKPNVLVQGELIVNAPIKMNGKTFFDFAPNNKVTLLSTFDFTGQDKAQKMINLQPNAVLNLQGKNVALITGMITYNNGTKIEMPQGKIADFVSTTFNGVGKLNMTGLNNKYGVSPAILRISNCTFNGLNKCIDLQHDNKSVSPSIFNISGSVFSEYSDFGILLTAAQQLYATNSSFFSNKIPTIQYSSLENIALLCPTLSAPPAIIGDDITGVVSLSACEITGVGARKFKERFVKEMQSNKSTTNAYNFLPLFGPNVEPSPILESFNVSVYLNNVPHFFMKEGTSIHDAFNGVFARGTTNIIMSKGAALINNGIGLNMAPEESELNALKPKGCLLFMDCSHLIDNALGILGRDVTLFTDEFVNSNYNNPNIFINFEQDEVKGRYFDIYYSIDPITKQSSHVYNGYTIFSRNNIWSNKLPTQTEEYHIVDCLFANGSSCIEYTIDADPPANAKGGDCYTLSNDDDPFESSPFKQGSINTQTGAISALPFAWSGISAMLNQNLDEMRAAFTPLAKVSDYERNNTESGYTQMYVDIAKAFVYAPSDDVPIEVDGRNAKVNDKSKSSVLVYPNPAHQWLTVELPTQNHRLQLADGLGRSVYNETVNGTTRINVGQYSSGVYHVIVTDANGAQTRSKVVVQHD